MSFFDAHPEFATVKAQKVINLPPTSQNVCIGECISCGAITDGLMLGICDDCE